MYEEDEKEDRTYFGVDVGLALDAWKKYESHPNVINRVFEIIRIIETQLGPIASVYKLNSNRYVAIRFGQQTTNGAWINVGYIDHKIEIQDSKFVKRNQVWRTYLPTGSQGKSAKSKPEAVNHKTCQIHFIQYPAYQNGCLYCRDEEL